MEGIRSLGLRLWLSWGAAFPLFVAHLAPPATAADPQQFEIPAQSLTGALVNLAAYADISIGLSGVNLTNRTSRPVTEYHGVADALQRLLAGTDLSFEMIDPTTWRILPLSAAPRPPAPMPTVPLILPPIEEITVTAAKRAVALQATPLSIVAVTGSTFGDYGIQSSQEMTTLIAGLSVTNQGPGKNKFVVRGLADGPFIGNTQSTVGVYVDDTRAIFNAPDPNLQLFDINRVEVIRGPQGTLYGAGSIGGIVRIITRQPILGRHEAHAEIDGALTQHGDASGATEAMVNVPLVGDSVALRSVAYARHDGGYINNSALGRRRVNASETYGVRANTKVRLSPDWSIGAGAIFQSIHVSDTQYYNAATPPFGRGNLLPEPSKNDFLDLHVTINGDLGWVDLVSTTAWLVHSVDTRFDASLALPSLIRAPVMPTAFDQSTRYRTINHETRFASSSNGSLQWLGGLFFSHHRDRSSAGLTLLTTPADVFYIKNRLDNGTELAAFGELKYHFNSRISAGVGARIYRGSVDVVANNSEDIDLGPTDAIGENRKVGVTPKAEVLYQINQSNLVYAQIAQGFRLGGINIASRVTTPASPGRRPVTVSNFDSDRLWNFEIGSKSTFLNQRLILNASAFYAVWQNVQADLIRVNGLSFTANLGNAHVKGFEIEGSYVPSDHWRLSSYVSWSGRSIPDSADIFAASITSRLPAEPRLTGTVAAQYQTTLHGDVTGYANLKYALTGKANLSVGSLPISDSGAYNVVNLRMGLRLRQWDWSLYINNVTDNRTNTYAFGNPFSLGRITQVIPLQPRTFGLKVRWSNER